ncbi:hypothetical protein [Vibrio sp. D431a]|uniref:hypothetical protein n=1 Tax=Vibrio sp. D431a TaxID=2837388 RepID=UPI002553014B|nr:hypothetical protein [Vibrio sp. D431a]MDK9790702.1 hypothetical protein [Vibrio sp. D431a]
MNVQVVLKAFQSAEEYTPKKYMKKGFYRSVYRLYDTSCDIKVYDADIKEVIEGQPLFVITTHERKDFEVVGVHSNNEVKSKSFRHVGHYLYEGEARTAVLNNACDIHEMCYDIVTIDEYKDGSHIARSWYEWEGDREDGSYMPLPDSKKEEVEREFGSSGLFCESVDALDYDPVSIREEVLSLGLYPRQISGRVLDLDGNPSSEEMSDLDKRLSCVTLG